MAELLQRGFHPLQTVEHANQIIRGHLTDVTRVSHRGAIYISHTALHHRHIGRHRPRTRACRNQSHGIQQLTKHGVKCGWIRRRTTTTSTDRSNQCLNRIGLRFDHLAGGLSGLTSGANWRCGHVRQDTAVHQRLIGFGNNKTKLTKHQPLKQLVHDQSGVDIHVQLFRFDAECGHNLCRIQWAVALTELLLAFTEIFEPVIEGSQLGLARHAHPARHGVDRQIHFHLVLLHQRQAVQIKLAQHRSAVRTEIGGTELIFQRLAETRLHPGTLQTQLTHSIQRTTLLPL